MAGALLASAPRSRPACRGTPPTDPGHYEEADSTDGGTP